MADLELSSHGDFLLGEWIVQPRLSRITRGNQVERLEPRCIDLLVFLARHPEEVHSRERLIDAVWRVAAVAENTLTHAIAELRKALGDDARDSRYIETIHKRGYRLLVSPGPVSEEESSASRTVSHFLLLEHLGAGGMGVVYRAHDRRLDRDVAIKVLPDEVARDKDRLARFEREAKLLASLSHPNIATMYGLEEHKGRRFLVMELAEGETLAKRIERGPLPVDDALDYACQIAIGLEAAHKQGIVHRDLKPANIVVGSEGQIKILDFGLAKAFDPKGSGPQSPESLAESPTLTAEMTREGVLLGTAAYMSPEQARGKAVDKRADIWAFGCVLYAMLTRNRAFNGTTSTEILAAIIKEEPDWDLLPTETPVTIRRLLRRCLAKDPRDRLHDIADARLELEESIRESSLASEITAPVSVGAASSRRKLTLALTGAAVAVAVGLTAWLWRSPESSALVVRRFNLQPPSGIEVSPSGAWATLAISPTGNWVAFEGSSADGRQLYIRSVEELQARPVLGTKEAHTPFFSPDGNWLGFTSNDLLQKVPIGGGEPLPICAVASISLRGASWGEDGTILFVDERRGLQQVSADGGEPSQVTAPASEPGREDHRWPQHLPGGRAALFSIQTGVRESKHQIAAVSLKTGDYRTLLTGGTYPRFVPPGYLMYSRLGTLFAVPFDPKRLEVTGEPYPVLEDFYYHYASGFAAFAASDSGSLVYQAGAPGVIDAELVWVDRDGNAELAAKDRRPYYQGPAISPDGKNLAVVIQSSIEDLDIWVYETERLVWTRLTFSGGYTADPLWSPDGKRLLYSSDQTGAVRIYSLAVDGSGDQEQLTTGPGLVVDWPLSFSPGGVLAFSRQAAPAQWDILMLPTEGKNRTPQPFLTTPALEVWPVFSPDGAWVAYRSNESGQSEIYVRPYPGPGPKFKISSEGGRTPRWNPSGREIFYRAGQGIWAVPVETSPEFTVGRPRLLFEADFLGSAWASAFDVSPDGQQFLLVKQPKEAVEPLRLVYAPAWSEELKRLVPTE